MSVFAHSNRNCIPVLILYLTIFFLGKRVFICSFKKEKEIKISTAIAIQ